MQSTFQKTSKTGGHSPKNFSGNAEALTSAHFALIPTIQMTPFETIQSMQLNNHRRIKGEVLPVDSTEAYEGSDDKPPVTLNLLTR
jgi:hypothetical protein